MSYKILLQTVFAVVLLSKATEYNGLKLKYDKVLSNPENWAVEVEDPDNSLIAFSENRIEVDVSKGATIWFREKMEGDIIIEYDATVVSNAGKNDRASDLNCFWMFTDPGEKDGGLNFDRNNRNGKFSNYHSLQGYYVGFGGHNNTKTRFRRYNGNINRTLLPEHDLSNPEFLIVPNKKQHIKLVVMGNRIQYFFNKKPVFDWEDEHVLKSGWFAFRTVSNHMFIENLKVYCEK